MDVTARRNEKREKMQYQVWMESEEYGGESFGPYDSISEAQAAMDRLKESADKLKDGVQRYLWFESVE
jgi:hypothetical protein